MKKGKKMAMDNDAFEAAVTALGQPLILGLLAGSRTIEVRPLQPYAGLNGGFTISLSPPKDPPPEVTAAAGG